MQSEEENSPSPLPSPLPSPNPPPSLLSDISNFKTPKPSFKNSNPPNSPFPLFFTASKQTPFSSSSTNLNAAVSTSAFRRRGSAVPSTRSKAARRLKALELEQSQSSRKAQIRREKTFKTLSKSISAWLNFLFKNPKMCGCNTAIWDGRDGSETSEFAGVLAKGKRESLKGGLSFEIGRACRSPKRQRNCSGSSSSAAVAMTGSRLSSLEMSLEEVCSFDDLIERMAMYLNPKNQNNVLTMMSQVAKNIDEGRLKMKAHCPIVTDVGLKEKATRVLLCYHPTWLRIGLHIVFGGDSLLPTEDGSSDQDDIFLKMIIEKHFFSHVHLAKSYAYNKSVEGLYRPGYFEALGRVILKRFLLLVLALDKAKCQSTLPVKYGIDGKDGGSPLLFNCQSHIKSSRQIIHEFLSTVMHGEGDLLAHLVIIGYKVSYQQSLLAEYDFTVTDLFEDLQDGLRLCRAVQLLQCDASILTKVVVPSDTQRKNLLNCGNALQFLKKAGVPLSDEDGVSITTEDVANGDKELILTLLWNMFVYLQVPLLIEKDLLADEISKIRGSSMDHLQGNLGTHMDMLLEWIQAICKNYHLKIDNFSSLVDGKALCCLLDYYFHNKLNVSFSFQERHESNGGDSIISNTDNTVAMHNFFLVQRVTSMLGNFPEVLQVSDILENHLAWNERSVIILLVFLSSQLIARKDMDHLNIHKLMGWNFCTLDVKSDKVQHDAHKPLEPSYQSLEEKPCSTFQHQLHTGNDLSNIFSSPEKFAGKPETVNQEKAAIVIQRRFRGSTERWSYLKMKAATCFIQAVIRAWLTATGKIASQEFNQKCGKSSMIYDRYLKLMTGRHGYLRIQKSVLLIQQAARTWIKQKHQRKSTESIKEKTVDMATAASFIQSYIRGRIARSRYVLKLSKVRKTELAFEEKKVFAAVKIQSLWRGRCIRRDFLHRREAIIKIQSAFRCITVWKMFKKYRQAAIEIQRSFRGHVARNRLLGSSSMPSSRLCCRSLDQITHGSSQTLQLKVVLHSVLKVQQWWKRVLFLKSRIRGTVIIQSHIRGWIARQEVQRKRHDIVLIQSHWRAWLIRRDFLCQRRAIIIIQSSFRSFKCWKTFNQHRLSTIGIQRFVRGQIARRRLLGASSFRLETCSAPHQNKSSYFWNPELKILLNSIVKLQKWWKKVLLVRSTTKSAITIQSHIRGWIARRQAKQAKCRVILIQSYWKGCLVRKGSREQFLDLRTRVQKSAANVDDSMRLINRLVSAVSELMSTSVSNILHTCATLDMATKHSQKCCETLVNAGAIDALLQLINTANRSTPYQEVLKHAFSTLRNLVRYPHLAQILINTHGSIEIIFRELLRNKEDGYFMVSDLLKKLCTTEQGLEAVCKLPAFLRRLNNLAEDLERKATIEKRVTARPSAARGHTERRRREAVELLQLFTHHLRSSGIELKLNL